MTDSSPTAGTINRWLALGLLSATVSLSGCAALGYRLGSTLPPDIRTVHIPSFVNKTSEPQLEVVSTRATMEAVQRDGLLQIATAGEADTILSVTLTAVELEPLRYNRQEAKTAEEYRLRIVAQVTFSRRENGDKLINGAQVQGRTTFEFIGDMASSKRRVLPDAAEDLAREIVRTVQEYW